MGTASLSSETPNLAKLLNIADFAMYQAKPKDRNYVCVRDDVHI
jgi:PleD family two-component response regulator